MAWHGMACLFVQSPFQISSNKDTSKPAFPGLEVAAHVASAEVITSSVVVTASVVLVVRIVHRICHHHATHEPTTDTQCGGTASPHALPRRCVTHHAAAVASAHHPSPVAAATHQAAQHATPSVSGLMAIGSAVTLLRVAATVALLLRCIAAIASRAGVLATKGTPTTSMTGATRLCGKLARQFAQQPAASGLVRSIVFTGLLTRGRAGITALDAWCSGALAGRLPVTMLQRSLAVVIVACARAVHVWSWAPSACRSCSRVLFGLESCRQGCVVFACRACTVGVVRVEWLLRV